MKWLAEKIKENPYFALIGWLATIISLVVAIAVPIIQAKRVHLSYSCITNLLVTDRLSEIDDLDIKYKGNTINQLSVTSVEICNTGNATIEDDEVLKKLRIHSTSDNMEVIFATVVSQSYDTNNCRVSYDKGGVTVYFDILEKNEKAVINVYHTGAADTVFIIDGKIKEGAIGLLHYYKNSIVYNTLTAIGIVVLAILLSIVFKIIKAFMIVSKERRILKMKEGFSYYKHKKEYDEYFRKEFLHIVKNSLYVSHKSEEPLL